MKKTKNVFIKENFEERSELDYINGKTYTRAEVEELLKNYKTNDELEHIVKRRVAREKTLQTKLIEETKKKAEKEYESKVNSLTKKIAELKNNRKKHNLSIKACIMLSNKGITVNSEILNIVLKNNDEEEMINTVEILIKAIDSAVEKRLQSRL